MSRYPYASLLSYYTGDDDSSITRENKNYVVGIKQDRKKDNIQTWSEYIGAQIQTMLQELSFSEYFDNDITIVPCPNSSEYDEKRVDVTECICNALIQNNLGDRISKILKRIKFLPKAANSRDQKDRPDVKEQLESLEVIKILQEPKKILLVDDVITTGSALFTAVNKIQKKYPNSKIYAFAVVKAINSLPEFKNFIDPHTGYIHQRRNIELLVIKYVNM